jgi:hypothetical protein
MVPLALAVLVLGYFIVRPSSSPTSTVLQPSPAKVALSEKSPSADIDFGNVAVPFSVSVNPGAVWLSVDPSSGDRLTKVHIAIKRDRLDPTGSAFDSEIQVTLKNSEHTSARIPVHLEVTPGTVPKPPGVDKKILPMNVEFPAWQVDTPQPSAELIRIPEEQLRLIHPHWQKANDERWFHFKTVNGGLSLSVTTTGMTVGNNSANLVLDLPDGDYHQVVVSIKVERGLEYKQQRDSIRWRGSLSPGKSVTIQGASCSEGTLAAGELPDKPFKPEAAKLKQESGLTVETPLPSAQNHYTLRLRNSGSATLTSFTLFYRAAK